jgi:hypothetical protein
MPLGMVELYSRDDKTDRWVPMSLGRTWQYSTTRAIGFHHDAITGVDLVFAGNDTKGILQGCYDPGVPGQIRWKVSPESEIPQGERVMGFCNCNGALYCATTRHIMRRMDGPAASWLQVYFCPEEKKQVGVRGLTAIANPAGSGEVLLFAARNKVRRLEPEKSEETIELDMSSFLTNLWGRKVEFVLAAYNEFFPFTIPGNGETVLLFGFESTYTRDFIHANPHSGLQLFVVDSKQAFFAAQARYFLRRTRGGSITYEVAEIVDPLDPTLVAVRTIAISPFVDDEGKVLYFGGFDCNSQPSHNTAWIYRGELQ